jgi:hypothetical protein
MNLSTPIFGEGGKIEGDLTSEHAQGPVSIGSLGDAAFLAPATTTLFRDRSAEAAQRQEDWDRIQMQLNPRLAKAIARLRRRQEEVRHWHDATTAAEAEVARIANLCARARLSVMHEDAEGMASRPARLAAAQHVLREKVEELLAAREELEIAQSAVDALTEAAV